MQNVTPRDGKRFYCLPDEATNGQMYEVVMKYLRDNPEQLHTPFRFLIVLAFEKAFPCNS